MSTTETHLPTARRAAAQAAEDRIDDEFAKLVAALPDDPRLRDELERAIDDVGEPELRDELRRLLVAFDEHRERLGWALHLSVTSALDHLRAVATGSGDQCL